VQRICRQLLAAAVVLSLGLPAFAQRSGWHDPDAPLRMRVSTGAGPSHPTGGYLLTLPSGGILPNGPTTVVTDESGKPLKHGVLCHDPTLSLSMVFDKPSFGEVYVYFKAGNVQRWTPDSGLHPSVVVFTRNGSAAASVAQQMASSLPGRGTHFFQNPLGLMLGGNPSGLGGPFSDYLLGYMVSTDPGRTYFSQMTWGGTVSFFFDGRPLVPAKVFDMQLGFGQWMEVDKNPHRVEWFQFGPGGSQARIFWRTPNSKPMDLGAQTPTNKAPWAAGPIPANAFIHSGRATATQVEAKDPETPVAAFTLNPTEYFWFEEQDPTILYELSVMPGNPKGTTYSWSMGPGLQVTNRSSTTWLMVTGRRYAIALTATKGDKTSKCEYQFDAFCGGENGSNINDPPTRARYRTALFNMFAACPLDRNVFSEWSPSMWDLFWRLVEPGQDKALAHIFDKRWEMACTALKAENRRGLEDLYMAMISPSDPPKALEWIASFDKADKDHQRRQLLSIRRAEIFMYYQPNFDEAEALVSKVAAVFSSPHRNLAATRQADIAFLKGDMDNAIKLYGEVQKRVKHAEQITEREERMQKASGGGLARSKDEVKAQREQKAPPPSANALKGTKDWRIGAVRDTAATETTRNLIRQGYFAEAKRSLEKWEMEFPLSKVSGDYILVEADYLIKTEDFVRANAMLTAYCKNIDMSSYLAQAMEYKIRCMKELKSPDKEMREFLEDVKKRFPFHPIGGTADSMLKTLKD